MHSERIDRYGGAGMDAISTTLDAVCLAARIILESGGETYRAEETVERMCAGLGIEHVDALALPTGIMLTLSADGGTSLTRIVRVRSRNINLKRLDDCNQVSRQVAHGEMSAAEALNRLRSIHASSLTRLPLITLAGALSSASFAMMLGGGWIDFGIAFICGALVQLVLPPLSRHRVPPLVSGLVLGFLTTLITLLGTLCFSGVTIDPIIGGAIMPMLPGLATTNAIRDTIRGDLVSGGARFTEAILTAVMIAAGICIMLSIWRGF